MSDATMTQATEALRAALDAKDGDAIRARLDEFRPMLWTYNPTRPTADERAFERAMQEADAWTYPRERCEPGRHLDDCMTRCGIAR